MSIKIAFFDIDWTLYDHKNHKWSELSLEGIKEAQRRGVKVVLCTARPFASMKEFGVFSLGIQWDAYISSAGATAFADGKFLRKTLIAPQRVRDFLALVEKEKLTCEIVEPLTRKLAFPQTSVSQEYYACYNDVIPEVAPYLDEEVTGFNLFAHEEEDAIFQKEFPDFTFFRYASFANDVTGEPHRKGDAIDCVLEHFHFGKEEAAGFGDDLQDLSMAEHVGIFVAMNNGKEEVKAAASFVTKDVWDDGVYYGLQFLKLID